MSLLAVHDLPPAYPQLPVQRLDVEPGQPITIRPLRPNATVKMTR